MPRTEDIETFKRELLALAREPEVLSSWGEAAEEPPAGISSGIGAPASKPPVGALDQVEPRGLAAKAQASRGRGGPSAAPGPAEEPEDLESLDEARGPDGAGGLEEAEGIEDADLAALLGEPSGGSESGGLDADLAALLGGEPASSDAPPEAPEASEAPPDGSFDADLAALLGEEEAAAGAEALGEDPLDGFDLAAFAGGNFDEPEPEPEGEAEVAAASPADEPFDLDSFGLLEENPASTPGDAAPALPAEEADPFADLLGSLGDEEPSARPEGLDAAPSEDFGATLSDEEAPAAPASVEDFDLSFAESELPALDEEAEAAPSAASPSMPEELDEFDSLESLEEAADEGLPESAALEESPSAGGGAEELGAGLDDFSIPEFGESGGGADPFAETASPVAPGAGDEFSLPGLDEADSGVADLDAFGAGASPFPEDLSSGGGAPDEGGPGGASPELDSFDSFSFDDSGPAALSGEDLDRELAALGEEPAEGGTFSLDESWGGDFAPPGAEAPGSGRAPPPRAGAGPAIRAVPGAGAARAKAAAEEKVREVSLSEAQVDRLQDRLLSLPLNVRVAVEDVVANEKGTEAQRSKLIWMLVEGAKAEEVAAQAGRVLKRRVAVPEGFEKSSGAAFQAEKGSLKYLFLHSVLPVLRVALVVLVAAGVLGWLGWKLVYTPLAADYLYRTGYARIEEDRYREAEENFARAGRLREFTAWYYRYAEAYAARRQFALAEAKYEALLARRPGELRAALDWARLAAEQLKYERAAEILRRRILERDYLNEEALLLLGDVYLAWGEEEPKYYEEARRNYAALVQKRGSEDLYLERMLLYFMRVDDKPEVDILKKRFMEQAKPFPSASTLAELGGYLLDRGGFSEARPILALAAEKDPKVAEAHYHLARYYRRSNTPGEERKALDNAISAFEARPSLGAKATAMLIDALVRRGDYRLRAKEYVAAEEDYALAAAEYEKALGLRRLRTSPDRAAAYAGLAEIAYWMRDDYPRALSLYEKAAEQGFDGPVWRYRRGYILYGQERHAEALEQFYRAGREGSESPRLLFAFGNALAARGDWFAAEAYYSRTVAELKDRLERVVDPQPQEVESQGALVELLVRAWNNLGVARYRVAERRGDPRKRGEALAAFAESTRIFDSLTRDRRSLLRPDAKNLGFLNLDFVLHPQRGMDISVYPEIEKDMGE